MRGERLDQGPGSDQIRDRSALSCKRRKIEDRKAGGFGPGRIGFKISGGGGVLFANLALWR